MGLFGSRKKTYVGTTVMRAIEAKNLPDSVRSGLFQGIQAEGNIPDYVMEELLASIGNRAERAYRYASKNYPYGLPFSQTLEVTNGEGEAASVISGIEGRPISIDYCNIAAGNTLHFAWMKLISTYGYNPATNELTVLSTQKGRPVYLYDLVPAYPAGTEDTINLEVIKTWGVPPMIGATPSRIAVPVVTAAKFTPPMFTLPTPQEQALVKFEWNAGTDKAPNIVQGTAYLDIDVLDDDADYIHVKYLSNGITKYWAYRLGSGTYPVLDALINKPGQIFGEFFPYLYFRHEKKPIAEDKESVAYKSAKKMSRILGMDYNQIHEAIHENPDIEDVQQAVMMFAVPMGTDDPLEIRYLYDFMRKMYFTQQNQYQIPSASALLSVLSDVNSATRNGIVIKDSLFELALRHDGIFKKMVFGNIGDVGTTTRTYSVEQRKYSVSIGDGSGQLNEMIDNIPVHTFKRQTSSAMYEEIQVWNMKTAFKVFEQYETIGDEEDEIFLVPIDRSITKGYSLRDKELLYAKGMHYVFNSRVVVKLKWYQTGLFKAILVIVAVVLAIWTGGASLQALAAGLAAGGAAATIAIMAILKKILIGIALSYAFKIFVKAVGLEAAFLVAIIAALAGAYQFVAQGANAGAPWVQEMLQLANGLTNAIGSVTQDMMGDLLGDYNNFLAEAEKGMDLLKDKQSLLDQDTWLSPFVVFGESPDDFFNRTVHSGNIGTQTIEAVTNYVQVALTLPKLAETLGDASYG